MTGQPHVIVLGNEKGGTGKSTAAMHLIVSLLSKGHSVGSLDVDARQGTLSRYIENRKNYVQEESLNLAIPDHTPIFKSTLEKSNEAQDEENGRFVEAIDKLKGMDFIVIDTPGSDSYLSRLAHSYADTLITPMNDSFIDLDMLVRVKAATMDILRPSTYAEMVWDQKKQRAMRNGGSVDWIVMRNRLSNINSKNKEEMHRLLTALSKRIGFRLIDGFGERVIFRELFLQGLTLLDLKKAKTTMTLSHVAGRQELADLISAIQLPPSSRVQKLSMSA